MYYGANPEFVGSEWSANERMDKVGTVRYIFQLITSGVHFVGMIRSINKILITRT